ncbi:MAG: NADH-quinone oxidoreductase subunit K [Planctomycetota bacterium]
MSFLLACVIGVLFAAGFYMLLRRSFVKLIIGLGLLGHGANLLIITAAGIERDAVAADGSPVQAERGMPPFIDPDDARAYDEAKEAGPEALAAIKADPARDGELDAGAADPLPPALILTAIVISFAIVSYTIVLVKRTYQEVGTDDLDQMTATDLTP